LPDLYRLKRLSGILCRIFERTRFGGDFKIGGDDIRRKYGVIDLSTKEQRKKGMGALSLPRRERTPLSAAGARVPFASDPTTLRLRFRSCKVKRCSPNSLKSIRADWGEALKGQPCGGRPPGDCISRNGGMSRILEGWRVTDSGRRGTEGAGVTAG
jgi:hypothetical protein